MKPILNSNDFIYENTFENVLCKMAAILILPQYIKHECTTYFFLKDNIFAY